MSNLLTSISAAGLERGDFRTELPEYYALRQYVEHSLWHLNQDVYSHCLKVMQSFEWVMKFEFLTDPARSAAKTFFAQQVVGMSRFDRLKAVVLLHDIAKPLVFKRHADGTAGCSSLHELLSAAQVQDFQVRLELTDEQAEQIRYMILLHGVVSEMINVSLDFKDESTYFEHFSRVAGDCTDELLCFIFADMMGADLDRSLPEAFEVRKKLLITWLQKRFSVDV